MKKRLLYYSLIKHLEHKNAIIITGMRQVGKTSLMRQLYDELGHEKLKLWFDFDNPLDQKLFEDEDYNTIYQRLRSQVGEAPGRLYLFLDEVQNYPPITKVIKYLIDHYQVKCILTGSSQFYLKNLFPESLSGRKFLYTLFPMNFLEYLYFKDALSLDQVQTVTKESLLETSDLFIYKKYQLYREDYIQYGGLPEVVLTLEPEIKKEVLRQIFASFFEKDIQLLSDYANIRELRDLLLLLVPRVGSKIEVSKLASELSIDRAKVYSYLELLQATFVIRLLSKYSKSIDRTVAAGKKVYFTDTGILRTIGQVNDGQLFENSVVNQLIDFGELQFYEKRNTAEIDLILDKKTAIEVKLKGSQYDQQRVEKTSLELGLQKSIIVSRDFVELKQASYLLP